MADAQDSPPSLARTIWLVVVLVRIFGILMAGKNLFAEVSLQAAITAAAGLVMGLSIYVLQDDRRLRDLAGRQFGNP